VDSVARAGQLRIPTDSMLEAAKTTRADVDEQVAASAEIASVVKALEQQYDEIVAGNGQSLVAEGARLPTADELGAEFERYLSQQSDSGDNAD
jgi:hypothetical protein